MPDPVSLNSRSLSGSEPKRASDLFFRIDFERLCVSPEPSAATVNEECDEERKNRRKKKR